MNSSSNYRLRNFLLCSLSTLMVLLYADLSIAKQVTFEREYTYQASEYDSKVNCRVNALEQVKRLLLEELGTYLESRTEVKDFNLTKDQIITLTAGIVRTEIVKETFDGKTYWLKAKIEADPDSVLKAIDELRKDHENTKELEEIKEKAAESLKEIERLKRELVLSKGDTKKQGQYNEAVKRLSATDWFEKGFAYIRAEKYQDAINAYTKAIELNPKLAVAYTYRGNAYYKSGNYNQAIAEYTRAIELDTKYAMAYSNRGTVYAKLGNYNQAIAEYTRAIELDPKLAVAYDRRGFAYENLGNHNQAIIDFMIAIELNPKYANAANAYYKRGIVYYNRGAVYAKLGNYNQAIAEYTRAIELYPGYANAYYKRGAAYEELGNLEQAFSDYRIAARLFY